MPSGLTPRKFDCVSSRNLPISVHKVDMENVRLAVGRKPFFQAGEAALECSSHRSGSRALSFVSSQMIHLRLGRVAR